MDGAKVVEAEGVAPVEHIDCFGIAVGWSTLSQ